jgi:hypothetical protein
VKPVEFTEFMKAIKQLGLFWAAINEPPPVSTAAGASGQSGSAVLPATNGLSVARSGD